jgi:hypothetical protein
VETINNKVEKKSWEEFDLSNKNQIFLFRYKRGALEYNPKKNII